MILNRSFLIFKMFLYMTFDIQYNSAYVENTDLACIIRQCFKEKMYTGKSFIYSLLKYIQIKEMVLGLTFVHSPVVLSHAKIPWLVTQLSSEKLPLLQLVSLLNCLFIFFSISMLHISILENFLVWRCLSALLTFYIV